MTNVNKQKMAIGRKRYWKRVRAAQNGNGHVKPSSSVIHIGPYCSWCGAKKAEGK